MTLRKAIRRKLLSRQLVDQWGSVQTSDLVILPGDRWFSVSKFMIWTGLIAALICTGYCLAVDKSLRDFGPLWWSGCPVLVGAIIFLIFIQCVRVSRRCARDLEDLQDALNLDPAVQLCPEVCTDAGGRILLDLARRIKMCEILTRDPRRADERDMQWQAMNRLKEDFNRIHALMEKFKIAYGKTYYYHSALTGIQSDPTLTSTEREILRTMH